MRYEVILLPMAALGASAAPFQGVQAGRENMWVHDHEDRAFRHQSKIWDSHLVAATTTTDACAALVTKSFPTNQAVFCSAWARGGTTQYVAPAFQTACSGNPVARISSVCGLTSITASSVSPSATGDVCIAQIKSSFPGNSALFCSQWMQQSATTQFIAPAFQTACSASNVYTRISSACTAIVGAGTVSVTSSPVPNPTPTGDACLAQIKSSFPTNSALFCSAWNQGGTTQFVAPAFQTACASNSYSRISSACNSLFPSSAAASSMVSKSTSTTSKPSSTAASTSRTSTNTVTASKTSSIVLNTPTTTSRASTTIATSTSAVASSSSFSAPAAYTSAVLVAHNVHRTNHSAPAISWSPSLAQIAADEAAVCYFAHNVTGGGGGYGQNIAAGVAPNGVAVIISDLFYNGEVNYFAGNYGLANPNFTNFEHWGHFSQVVWKASTSVGCATVDCSASGLGGIGSGVAPWFTVCNYESPGNFGGEYADNIGVPLNQSTVTGFYYS